MSRVIRCSRWTLKESTHWLKCSLFVIGRQQLISTGTLDEKPQKKKEAQAYARVLQNIAATLPQSSSAELSIFWH
jgi:hypothetical protein